MNDDMNHEGEMIVNCEMVLISAEVKDFFSLE